VGPKVLQKRGEKKCRCGYHGGGKNKFPAKKSRGSGPRKGKKIRGQNQKKIVEPRHKKPKTRRSLKGTLKEKPGGGSVQHRGISKMRG